MFSSLWKDAKVAARMLARSPGFAAAAVLTLALGIGVNTALFSVIHAVLVREIRPALVVLSAAVVWVLLIACANVANLLLPRATTRSLIPTRRATRVEPIIALRQE